MHLDHSSFVLDVNNGGVKVVVEKINLISLAVLRKNGSVVQQNYLAFSSCRRSPGDLKVATGELSWQIGSIGGPTDEKHLFTNIS